MNYVPQRCIPIIKDLPLVQEIVIIIEYKNEIITTFNNNASRIISLANYYILLEAKNHGIIKMIADIKNIVPRHQSIAIPRGGRRVIIGYCREDT